VTIHPFPPPDDAPAVPAGRWLTVKQTIAKTGYSKDTIYRLIKRGEFVASGAYSLLRIAEASIDAYLLRNMRQPEGGDNATG
jgi:predicted DNA-binding transcriptional regulator AlpA